MEQVKKEVVKLTDWAKEPTISELKRDFDECQSAHSKHVSNLERWDAGFNVAPLPENKDKKAQSRISPKLIRKQYEWRCASLSEPFLSTPELFRVNPVTHEDTARAKQNELILNYQFQTKINKVPFIDGLIRTCVRDGTVIVRTGWDFQEIEEEVQKPVWSYEYAPPEFEEQLQQLVELMQTEPDSFEANIPDQLKESVRKSLELQQAVIATQTDVTTVKEMRTIVNKPVLEICDSRNVYVDPTCEGDTDKAKFFIYSFESCIADLKADGRYKNLDMVAKGLFSKDSPYHTYADDGNFTFADIARRKFTVYEYWGLRDIEGEDKLTAIMASWVGSTGIRMELNPFPDKKPPFTAIPYIPEYKSVYGIPDGELLEDNQKILGAVTRGVIDLLGKSANSQTGVPKGLLDATNLIKYKKGADYEYNPTSNPQAIFMHKYPEIPQSAMWIINQQNNEAESLSGIKAFAGGGITGAGLGESATGVRSAMDAVSKREMSILRRIAHGLLVVARKMLAMNAAWLSEEEVVRLTNGQFVPVRADDLEGDFDLQLAISTAEADEAKAKELAFMLQTMGNTMGMEMGQLILSEIARLRKMPELANRIENYKPAPDPMAEEMHQLEMQKLQAEIQFIQAQAQEAAAKSQVQGAKVGVEQARAENLQGDADLKSQTFVENETGDRHLKDLQKQEMANEGVFNQQKLKGEQTAQQSVINAALEKKAQQDVHNNSLLKSYADTALTGNQATRQ